MMWGRQVVRRDPGADYRGVGGGGFWVWRVLDV